MPSVADLLERQSTTVDLEPGSFERLVRRRNRRERNRRLSAGTLAVVLALVSLVALTRAFRSNGDPAHALRPSGIFSDVGGWIAYGRNDAGIWAVDPSRPHDPSSQIQLSTTRGTPLAWSEDGSKLLILSYERRVPHRLFVLNADGTETTVATSRDLCRDAPGSAVSCAIGASISPDGSHVIYDAPSEGSWRSSIHVVGTDGGAPRILLSGGPRFYAAAGRSILSWLSSPAYSPDGNQIAYFDHQLDGPSQLRVMNADGTGVRVLLDGTGYHVSTLTWSPDGERLAWAGSDGIYVVGADGSGLTLAIPGGADPYWSPDGTRIAYRIGYPRVEVAAPDGTHVQVFWGGGPGPWNPLVQP